MDDGGDRYLFVMSIKFRSEITLYQCWKIDNQLVGVFAERDKFEATQKALKLAMETAPKVPEPEDKLILLFMNNLHIGRVVLT